MQETTILLHFVHEVTWSRRSAL